MLNNKIENLINERLDIPTSFNLDSIIREPGNRKLDLNLPNNININPDHKKNRDDGFTNPGRGSFGEGGTTNPGRGPILGDVESIRIDSCSMGCLGGLIGGIILGVPELPSIVMGGIGGLIGGCIGGCVRDPKTTPEIKDPAVKDPYEKDTDFNSPGFI